MRRSVNCLPAPQNEVIAGIARVPACPEASPDERSDIGKRSDFGDCLNKLNFNYFRI